MNCFIPIFFLSSSGKSCGKAPFPSTPHVHTNALPQTHEKYIRIISLNKAVLVVLHPPILNELAIVCT